MTLVVVATLNTAGASWPTVALVACGFLVYQLPGLLSDLVGGMWNPPFRSRFGWAAAAILCLIPGGFALLELGSFKWLLSAGVAVGSLIACGTLGWFFQKMHRRLELDLWALLIASLQAVALFVLVHLGEETLSGLEDETFQVRILAYLGTALGAFAVAVIGTFRIGAMRSPSDSRWRNVGVVLMSLLVGTLFLYADRTYFVGLYFWYHVFLFIGGVLALEGAFTVLFSAFKSRAFTVFASLSALILVSLLTYLYVAPLRNDLMARSETEILPVGPLILSLFPPPTIDGGARDHAALQYEKFHDYEPDLPEFNVLLITIDTLRKDYVGPNAPHQAAAPVMTEFAAESSDFINAYAPSSHTAVSMGSFFAGKYSANLDWRLWIRHKSRLYHPDRISDQLRKEIGTRHQYTTIPEPSEGGNLTERIQECGLYTMATPYLASAPFFRRGVGYEKGFDVYRDYHARYRKPPTSMSIVTDSIEQIDAAKGKRWFQWTHLFDPHSSKADPKRYAELVRHTDDAVGFFFNELKKRGYWENTIIVITSDHGEQMEEHGKKYHGVSLFNEEVQVPLIIRVPGTPARTLEEPVSLVDVAPTLASLVGGDLTGLDGVNLAPFILEGHYPENRPVFTELHRYLKRSRTPAYDEKAVIFRQHKLIHNRKTGSYLMFDLATDPGEKKNLIGTLPETQQNLIALLQAFVDPAEEQHPLPGEK